jgi:hypothetical protein
MPISFTCPHCGIQTEVADEYAGQSGPCSGCGKIVTVRPSDTAAAGAGQAAGYWGPVLIIGAVLVGLLGLFACGGFFFYVAVARTSRISTITQIDMRCQNNLKQLGMAMHQYADVHDSFPPAYVTDDEGKPLYSWRVLLLPYLEEAHLHEQFNLDEPWDSEHNRTLADMMPSIYMCPSDASNDGSETNYVMIVGGDTLSDGPTGRKAEDITDGLSCTIMLVETTASGINWAEPRDLDAKTITFGINDGSQGISGNHVRGCHILMADGSTHRIDPNGPLSDNPQAMQDLSTISGGEYVDPRVIGQ